MKQFQSMFALQRVQEGKGDNDSNWRLPRRIPFRLFVQISVSVAFKMSIQRSTKIDEK